MRIIALGIGSLLIVYGSLYPFEFSQPPSIEGALANLFAARSLFTSRGDVLGNVALFVPLGVIAGLRARLEHRLAAWPIALLIAFALSLACQIGQLFVPARDGTVIDVVWNMIGMTIGLALGGVATEVVGRRHLRLNMDFVIAFCVVAAWMLAELTPLVPALDLQLIRNNLLLMLKPTISWPDLLLHASGPLTAAALLDRVLASRGHVRTALIGLICVILVGRTITISTGVDLSCVIGLLTGYCVAEAVLGLRETRRHAIAVALLFIAITAKGLDPLVFNNVPSEWHWLPFAGWLEGSMMANAKALAGNTYLYAAILSLVLVSSGHVFGSTLVLTFWVLLLEITQLWIVGRTGDITEPLTVLAIGICLRSLNVAMRSLHYHRRGRGEAVATQVADPNGSLWLPGVIEAAVFLLAVTAAIAVALRMPNIPYNVRELFLGNGHLAFVVIFALALLWTGAGAAWMAQRITIARLPVIAWPLSCLAASVISLMLLSMSVTQESVADIAGSTNLYWFVTNKDLWGPWARTLFLWIDSPRIINLLERPVRYAALYGPVIVFLAVAWLCYRAISKQIPWSQVGWMALASLPWLWLCKAIAFDWSSTDNLNELITRDGEWGFGGGGYLYVLLAIACANATLVASVRIENLSLLARAALTTLLALPVGWLLINLGLGAQIQKYGQTFSGVQFLLGPDRAHKLTEMVLFGRWCVVQLAATLVLAEGLRLGSSVMASLAEVKYQFRTKNSIRG